ncbi:MAG: aldo/keto reductase [Chitinophagaceae bacterium]|nr:aldo/keto reductase [Chitinophagaceae bacterium]
MKKHSNKTWKIGGELEVNRFGFGAMRITGEGIIGPPKNEKEAIRVLRRAVELGVNFIDTADSYGPNVSEELIAKALYPYPKDLIIATKGGQLRPGPDKWVPDGRPEHLKEVLHGSLKRLKLERIDLYQLHRRDPKVPFDETLGYLKEAQKEGLIRFIGLSELGTDSVKEALKIIEVVSLQNKFSFDHRKWEHELEYCAEKGIAFIPWHPMNAGNLIINENLKRIASGYDASVHQIALKWLFNYAPNILLIPGTSNVRHLEENLSAANIELSDADFETISKGLKK